MHHALVDVPPCDLLIVAGDIGDHRFLCGPFKQWLNVVPADAVVVIAGNHERTVQSFGWPYHMDLLCHYLQDNGIELFGLKIWGTPWTPWFLDWAFNAPRLDHEERFLTGVYSLVPEDTDVLVVHGPPYGVLDVNSRGKTCGSRALLRCIERVQPRLVVCGHIHEAYGTEQLGDTLVVNAAVFNDHPPVEVTL